MQIVLGFGVTSRDDSAFPSQSFEPAPEIATANGRKRDLLATNARSGENIDQIGTRVSVVALPEFGLLERTAFDKNTSVDGGAAGCWKRGCKHPERRT